MGLFEGLLSGGAAIADSAIAYKNYQLQKDTFAWQKEAQQNTWAREDSAVQRRIADLKAAGLSPTLAAGSAAGTSAPIKPQTPQIESGLGTKVAQKALMAREMLQQKAQYNQTNAQTELIRAQAEKAKSEANYLRGTEQVRIQGTTAQQQEIVRGLQDRLGVLANQRDLTFRQAETAEYGRQIKSIDAEYYNQLRHYEISTSGWQSGDSGFWTENPMVLNYMIGELDRDLRRHDVRIYEKLPVPSGILGTTVSSITSLPSKFIR